jgi:D-alanyl-D-alanine carboxypeptidase
MPKKFTFLLLFSFFIFSSCGKETTRIEVSKEPFQAILDKKIKPYQAVMQGKAIGIGLYIKGEKLDLYVSTGLPEAYQENIYFRGASTTKTFTAAAILNLQQQGKLNIDDRLVANIPGTNEPYLPNTPGYAVPYKEHITIRQLLNHRAGIFDVTNTPILSTVDAPYAGENYIDYLKKIKGKSHTSSFEEMIAVIAKHKLSYFAPNTAVHYSNTGYNILAVIVQRVSGKPLHQYMQEEFLIPLGMRNTFFTHTGSDRHLPQPSVTSWLKIKNELLPYNLDNVASAMSEGNIVTTPKDLSTWAYHLYASKKVLNEQHLQDMITNIAINEQHAYITTMRYHPGTKKTYLVFSTFFNYDDFQQQADDIDAIIREAIKEVEINSL